MPATMPAPPRSLAAALMLAAALTGPAALAQTPPARPPARPAPAAATTPAAAPAAPVATFPGGASSLSEEHGDWTVNCNAPEGRRSCSLSQAQGNRQTGRRVFALDLRPVAPDRAEGVLLLPFGLRLASGAKLELDEQPFGPDRGFSTCVEAGCLVPVVFDAGAVAALQRGASLRVSALNSGNGEAVSFSASLGGFTSALRRARELGG